MIIETSKKYTINDIAKELNVTASTVSRALNDNPRISNKTKEAVKRIAAATNYQVNGIASALQSGRTYTIGVIVPTTDRSFFSSVIRGIEEVANKSGYNVMICQSNDNYEAEKEDINALLKARVDCIILSVAKQTIDYKHIIDLKKQNIPIILFDRVNERLGFPTVTIDDYNGAFKAVEHLVQQGCKRIATLTGIKHLNIFRERLRGYKDALEYYKLPYNEDYVVCSDLRIDDGKTSTKQLMSLPHPPDAIFCASDNSALGAMQWLKENNIKIPQEVALVGFANEFFTAYVEPALTTIDQCSQEMGQIVAQLFLELTNNKDLTNNTTKNITLSSKLIVRASSLRK
jgi:LacI family transcriptional regulator